MNEQTSVPGSIHLADILGLSFQALRQQKVRSVLTLAGVVIGTFTLAVSLAIGRGVDRAIVALFQVDDRIRKIIVSPRYEPDSSKMPEADREPRGTMSEAKRNRLRKAIVNAWGRSHGFSQKVPLTTARMDELSRLPHVQSVEPMVFLWARAEFAGKKEQVNADLRIERGTVAATPAGSRPFSLRRRAAGGDRR